MFKILYQNVYFLNAGPPKEKPWMAVYVVWTYESKCYGQSVRDHCLYGVGDLKILTSRPEIMANRIDVDFEPLSVDCLEAWHRFKEICPPAFNQTFYESFPFVNKKS